MNFMYDKIEHQECVEYKGKFRKISINNKIWEAFFPEGHSTIEGIIFNCRNLNADKKYTAAQKWYLNFFLLRKGEHEWRNVYAGLKEDYDKNNKISGIFPILFSLEDSLKKEKLKQKISKLKESINKNIKKLKKLTGKDYSFNDSG